jgi:DNA-binding MarR family transcriptional regulator
VTSSCRCGSGRSTDEPSPDPDDGRRTLAVLSEDGWAKVVETPPGRAEAVRRCVFESLTEVQVEQLRDIGHRIMRAIGPGTGDPPPTWIT